MRPLVRSYGVISTRTLSPASTRMRFLRILPAVWAIISWSFSSLTRKVALGSNSTTNPGNSNSSSFDIGLLLVSPPRRLQAPERLRAGRGTLRARVRLRLAARSLAHFGVKGKARRSARLRKTRSAADGPGNRSLSVASEFRPHAHPHLTLCRSSGAGRHPQRRFLEEEHSDDFA